MLKHIDDIRKSARERATRKWKNHQVEQTFKAAKKKASESAANRPKPIEPADVLEQQKLIAGHTTKFESAFVKEIRSMMEGNAQRHAELYALSLEARKRRLLSEKLKRLQAGAQRGEQR
jgi:hypothetical protein